ncbi:hypothetical protein GHT06_013436 [Daphnia sinensis]|uniref:Uncharacterized protein n=1 Tax=Daphnia sinensis TaxID=1820382 RepID=A0AAD5KS99_9CRUS|nr:hypothetical protein GHT06_013436 [Daphnia sinensis]
MASSRSRNGSITSMPDIGIPDHPNRRDTGVGSQSGSTNPSQRVVLTPEERLRAIEVARVERDTLVVILERQCREIEEMINNRGRRSILKHLKTQMQSRLDEVDMIHNVVPSDAQRHAFLKQLLTTEVRSYIAEYLDNPSTYYDALIQLKKRYGQPQVHVSFGSFHGQDPQFQSTTVSLTVKARDRSFEADLKQVSTVPTQYLKLPCPPKELMEIRSRYPHLKDVKLVEVGEPTILIGAGNQWLHLRLDERLPPVGTDAPFGILTPFGWTCVGDLTLGTQEHDSTNHPKIRERERNSTKPFNSTEPDMNALRRLFSIENKFSHNSNFAERYKAVIDDYVAKGFARPLKESELKGTFGRNWYLPHHGVVNPRKPEKVRVVFDASAKYQGVALNERKAGVPIGGYSANVSSSWREGRRPFRSTIPVASTWLFHPPLSAPKCFDIMLTYIVKNFQKPLNESTRTSM